MNCDDARATLHRLTGQTPHTPTPAEMRELAEPDAPPETHTRATESRSNADADTDTSDARQAGRSAHSKPYVWELHGRWYVDALCCDDLVELDQSVFRSQPTAMNAALAHVREHHTPKDPTVITLEPDILNQLQAVLDQFRIPYYEVDEDGDRTPRNYDRDDFTTDPAQAMWADALDRAHNNPGGRS